MTSGTQDKHPLRCETCKERFSSDMIEYVHDRCPMSVWLNKHLKLEFLYSHIGVDLLWLITSIIGCASHSSAPICYPDYQDICGSIRSMANGISNALSDLSAWRGSPYEDLTSIEKRLWEIADALEKRYKEDRARGPVTQQPTVCLCDAYYEHEKEMTGEIPDEQTFRKLQSEDEGNL